MILLNLEIKSLLRSSVDGESGSRIVYHFSVYRYLPSHDRRDNNFYDESEILRIKCSHQYVLLVIKRKGKKS